MSTARFARFALTAALAAAAAAAWIGYRRPEFLFWLGSAAAFCG